MDADEGWISHELEVDITINCPSYVHVMCEMHLLVSNGMTHGKHTI